MINEQSSKAKHSSWWKRRTRMEKWLFLLLALLLIIIIIILAVKLSAQIDSQVCFTPDCVQTAAKVLEKVDLNTSPCQNFYKFACGNFIKNTVLPQSKTSISSFSIVSDMVDEQMRTLLEKPVQDTDARAFVLVKSIYQACMNTTEIEAHALENVKKTIKGIGGWPVVEGFKWNERAFDWTETIYKFMRMGMEYDIFFEFNVFPEETDSTKHTLLLDQPFIVSFDKLMRRGYNESIVRAYHVYMSKIAMAFGAEEERAYRHMLDVINLDIAITRITVPSEKRRNSSLEDNRYSIKDLEKEFPYVPWLQYINTMLDPVKIMTYDDNITVTLPQYFKELKNIITSTPKQTMANYIFWKGIKGLIQYLSNDLRALQLDFFKVVSGRTEREPRWKECVQKVKSRLHVASSALYVRHFFKEEAKKTMVEIINNIQAQFMDNLRKVDWMDEVTRKHALEKAKVMKAHIAYPDELLNDEIIDYYYQNLSVDRSKYLGSMRNVTLHSWRINYAKLNERVDKKDWREHSYAVVTNAFYDQNGNNIEFPASILQGVFFDNNRPQYMNYGAIGYIIGHEITHGFDDSGRQYDKDGNLVDWWQPKTQSAFEAKAQCIIDQYSNITVPEINLNLNGINTQGENIADNGGIKQAYLAYKKWAHKHHTERALPGLPYTPEQMFWISAGNTWCDVERREELKISVMDRAHAPSYYRVNVPLMNSEYFAKDFNCPIGSPMNPKRKCRVW
ncbi:neprilysin-2 [Tribolium castaneum]|uniref:Membrane metallo-endopeptidase-like 1 n=1 Tax=Tribolium castaneum TaxID=7070 RepID=D6WNY2_TRICA|nr:PREDICTED: membrane metallo-endopeptidase-like 1 [Tribolium castaneum]EFA03192.1 Membrane metallo-endopeptidase-like 1 [Tribolium castaneum]|eukprot:XP_974609.1 PREDICTED: membrane metallo-endopeptidase-like 1 [Tribolium castaneum]